MRDLGMTILLPRRKKTDPTQMLESGLADFSLRELLSMLLSSVGLAERRAYLERVVHDKPNGFYDRSGKGRDSDPARHPYSVCMYARISCTCSTVSRSPKAGILARPCSMTSAARSSLAGAPLGSSFFLNTPIREGPL